MIVVLGDLIADFSLRIGAFPVAAGSMQRVEYLELGPGGACNTAIAAARLGLAVCALGEVGDDRFGAIVSSGLKREGVEVGRLRVVAGGETPVAGVLVDARGEPAYLGYPGTLRQAELPPEWAETIDAAQALFADGWADHSENGALVLQALERAQRAGRPVFFDPGPGNPAVASGWHVQAAARSTVVLATEEEARRLTGLRDPIESARALLALGPELVVLKRGVAGCVLVRADAMHIAPGLPVDARDATGAGDSLAAAVIYGHLRGLALADLGTLANATGAAKVEKLGTGHNVPTRAEVRVMLRRFGGDAQRLLPD